MHQFRLSRVGYHLIKGDLFQSLNWAIRCMRQQRDIARWEAKFRHNTRFEMILREGVHCYLYRDSLLCQTVFLSEYEKGERQFLLHFLRPGDIFVDVGANFGLYTLIAAKCVGNSGHVYAFEPSGKTFQRLVDNVILNHFTNVECFNLGLSDSNTTGEINISLDGFDAWNSLSKPTAGERFDSQVVHLATWNDFAKENNLEGKVQFMKIDVEGWEAHVLAGGCQVFERADAPSLQIEFADAARRSAGSSSLHLYRTLENLGYSMFIYDPNRDSIVSDPLRIDYPYVNLIATKQPELIRARLHEHPR